MQEGFIEFMNQFGYVGIALLILIENVFPPIPSEVILVFGGFMTTNTEMKIPLVIVSATIGAMLGAAVLYLLGRILKKSRIERLFSGKFGKVLHLRPEDVTKAETWFMRYEYKAVLICRCVPVVRSLISIPAGMSNMKPIPFFALTLLGTSVWNTILVFVGAMTGEAWESSLKYINWYSKIVLVGIAIAGVASIIFLYKKNKKAKEKKEDGE